MFTIGNGTLRRKGEGTHLPSGKYIPEFVLVSNDAAAVVEAEGYFDARAEHLPVGSHITAVLDLDGDPHFRHYIVTANDGEEVTVSVADLAGGQAHIADITLAAVAGVDGTGDNAASKEDVDTRLGVIQAAINGILANLEASGINSAS